MKENRRQINLRHRRTSFIEILRTTPAETVCPNFYVLAHASGCAFSPACSYCYLKSSFWHLKKHEVFTNTSEMLSEVCRWIKRDKLETYMLNSGNLSDSLSLESYRPIIESLVETFREHAEARSRKHTLLLVTKGGMSECHNLLKTKPCASVIISFSINHPIAARQYEKGAAPVTDRLKAANLLAKKGWRVRIRIDPMILGFNYSTVAQKVRKIKPERVTLGSLRAEPSLYRFAGGRLFDNLIPPKNPRSLGRYPVEERVRLYKQAVGILKNTCPIGLCEETPEVWDALGLDKESKSCNCAE